MYLNIACTCLFGCSHTYGQHACVCLSFCPHPVISLLLFLCSSVPLLLSSFPPLLLAVQLGEAGLESKVQVCRLADESQRGSFPPTVCKYVVTLIERSSSSQQLSFLLLSVCVRVFVCVCEYVCVCVSTTGAAGDA